MFKGKWLASAMCTVVFKQLESKSGNVNERIESVSDKMRVKGQGKSETKYMRFGGTILLES
jgi:hypothetical protein